jgi:methylenetetrahydrofolate--tRNA-(uracil-5-)-methyltransferase
VTDTPVSVIGAGLAGSEAAFQLAARGIETTLYEMRPCESSPAHHTDDVAELVCSNSFKSRDPLTAAGMLKAELRVLGSVVLACAEATAVPAGGALAVDRAAFSTAVAERLAVLPALTLVRQEVSILPEGRVIVATGPLTSPGFEPVLSSLVGPDRLSFFDAAAPIVSAETLDTAACFDASRYGKGEGSDYINCPMEREEYEAFIDALLSAERVTMRDFENAELFQACQPVEEVARRGRDALRFGAMKPVGLIDPRTGRRPWAVVQLRAEDHARSSYNLVGFQTNLTFPEQRRVFSMVPGLAHVEILRYGVMHRNTFVDAPRLLTADLALRACPRVRLAGQVTGTEGYLEAAASGLLAALGTMAAREGLDAVRLPEASAFGALVAHAIDPETGPYQPRHVNLGILPPLEPPVRDKRARREAYAARAEESLRIFLSEREDLRSREVLSVLKGSSS